MIKSVQTVAMRAITRTLMATAIAAAVSATAACGAGQSAEDIAKDGARNRARAASAAVEGVLRDPKPRTDAEILQEMVAVASGSSHRGTVFGQSTSPTGSQQVDVAFTSKGEANHDQVIVRLCVQMTGMPGIDSTVTMADTPCGASLPKHDDFTGGDVDMTIHLKD